MLNQNIFKPNDNYFEEVESNIWLMDNHKWALYIWERYKLENEFYKLVHVDYHWDAVYDFWDNNELETKMLSSTAEQLKLYIENEDHIQYDSFIGPAIARRIINEIHFLCYQDDGGDKGFYLPILDKFDCSQTIHENSSDLSDLVDDKPLIFDFCLDVFNRSEYNYESDLWSDEDIDNLLNDCKELVQSANVVTISMSYGCSGTAEDTKLLTERVVHTFIQWRNDFIRH